MWNFDTPAVAKVLSGSGQHAFYWRVIHISEAISHQERCILFRSPLHVDLFIHRLLFFIKYQLHFVFLILRWFASDFLVKSYIHDCALLWWLSYLAIGRFVPWVCPVLLVFDKIYSGSGCVIVFHFDFPLSIPCLSLWHTFQSFNFGYAFEFDFCWSSSWTTRLYGRVRRDLGTRTSPAHDT